MKDTLIAGMTHELSFDVTDSKTVPALYPESGDFSAMPGVFATGFLVGFLEWACVALLAPHLDEDEQTLGTHISVSHDAATPPGFQVTAKVSLVSIEGHRLRFEVEAHDGVDLIAKGTHMRALILRSRFDEKLRKKIEAVAR